MTLRRRILWGTLSVAMVTLIAGLIGATAIRQESREAAQEELFRQAEVTAQLVEDQVEAIHVNGEVTQEVRQRVQEILDEVRLIGGHDFLEAALVIEKRGLVYLSDIPMLLPQLHHYERTLLVEGQLDREVRTVMIESEPVIATFRSITPGEQNSPVRIVVAIGRFDTFVIGQVITQTLLFALVIGAIAAIILALWISRSLGHRLEVLSSAARSYAGGDFDIRAPAVGDDELTEVGEAFNEMAEELEGLRLRERDFLMSVGHDLRTPLTTIRGYAEGLDSGALDADDLPRVAGVLHSQTDRLSRLVEDVMLLARLQSKEFALQPESVDLAAHLGGIVEAYKPRAGKAEVSIKSNLKDVGRVIVDPDRVAQIVGNLLDNAMRYTPARGAVTVDLGVFGKTIRLSVSDTGPGIDPDDLPYLFDRLYLSQRYRAVRSEGSGLGLSIVKELVEAMGGEISVSSILGEGTKFSVTFRA